MQDGAAPRASDSDKRFRAIAWMLVASLMFSIMTVSARLGSAHLPWSEVAFARCLVGLIVALSVARVRRDPLKLTNSKGAWGRSLFGTAAMLATFYTIGAPEISLGDASALRSTSPIFIAFLAPWAINERTTKRIWVATPLAFAGVVALAQPSFEIAGHLAFLSVLAAFFSACAMMFLRKLGPNESAEAVAAHFSAVGSAVALLIMLADFVMPDANGWLWLALTGVSSGLGQLTMTRAYALDHAARVGTIGYVGVVTTQIIAALWLGEIPTALQVVGSALVIAGGLWLALERPSLAGH